MWKLIFELKHDSCLIAPRCIKYNVTDLVYLLNSWSDDENFYYTEAHILQGSEENKKNFINSLKKDKSFEKVEVNGNFIITLNKRDKWMSIYSVLFDPKIIQTKPVVQSTGGNEFWELSCWDKKPLMNILKNMSKEPKFKLKSIEETELNEIFLPHIMPKLSKRQKQVLQLAVKEGYYDFPRKIDLGGLSKIMGLKKQTTQQHLRIAEKKLVPFLTEGIM